jgi:adenylate cyclase
MAFRSMKDRRTTRGGGERSLSASPPLVWSVRLLLPAFVAALVIPTGTLIGLTTYVNTRREITRLANANMVEAARQAREKTADFLGRAEPTLRLTLDLLASDPACGATKRRPPTEEEWKARARLLLRVKQAHPEITMIHFADEFGDFTMADRYPGRENGAELEARRSLWLHHRWIRGDRTYGRLYEARSAAQWGPPMVRNRRFDARQRLWYKKARHRRKLFWSPPYLFVASQRPGITASLPLLIGQRAAGVLGLSFELKDLSPFVKALSREPGSKVFLLTEHLIRGYADARQDLAPTDQVFMVTDEGVVFPDGMRIPSDSGPDAVRSGSQTAGARDHSLIAAARRLYQETRSAPPEEQRPVHEFRSANAHHLGVYQRFNVGNLRWMVVVAVPEVNVLGPVRRNSLLTLAWCLLALLASLAIGATLAARIARPLRAFAREMRQVEQLLISPTPSPSSVIEEVRIMGQALDRMKASLSSFQKYVPADLVRALLRSGQEARLGGETATLTLMFADIANFTPISERLSPTELVDVLADYFEEVEAAISRHDGIVDKYIGDAVMAFWGAPISPTDSPEQQACAAVLEYLERVQQLKQQHEAEGRTVFEARIGLHTGEALVGNMGSQRRMNYTAMGDSVNVAKRLEELNRTYGTRILISEATYMAVQEEFEARLIDRVLVRGRSTPIRIYELLGRRGQLDERLRPVLEHYAEGLRLYVAREWQPAADEFQQALDRGPDPDGPSRLFLARCRTYSKAPPPEDWDGVSVAGSSLGGESAREVARQ